MADRSVEFFDVEADKFFFGFHDKFEPLDYGCSVLPFVDFGHCYNFGVYSIKTHTHTHICICLMMHTPEKVMIELNFAIIV